MPDFSFDLQVLGGDVTLLPGLEAWLNSYVRHSLLRCAPFCSHAHSKLARVLACGPSVERMGLRAQASYAESLKRRPVVCVIGLCLPIVSSLFMVQLCSLTVQQIRESGWRGGSAVAVR